MYGMGEGLTDIFVQPYAGAQKEGTLGAVKGVGKGTVSLVTKTASGKHTHQMPQSFPFLPILSQSTPSRPTMEIDTY